MDRKGSQLGMWIGMCFNESVGFGGFSTKGVDRKGFQLGLWIGRCQGCG